MILIKRVNPQESGFSGATPNQRGRYLLISKNWLANFPALSTTHENDATFVVLDVVGHGKVVLPFVWHNSKKVHNQSNGRDEYRLYTSGMERAGMPCPNPGDLVALHPFKETNGNQFKDHFKFRVIRQSDPLYQTILSRSSTGNNYWELPQGWASLSSQVQAGANTYDGAATKPSPSEAPDVLVSDPSADDEQSSEQVPVALDSGDIARFLNNTPAEVLATRMSAQTFRDVVLASYSGRCAITGKALQVGGHLNVEAAHIQPRAHDGSNLPSNGIALSRDLHWGFDKGAFTLKEDLTVEVHPSLMNTDWWEFNGRVLQVPENSFFRPALESIRHHRTRVYGRFLYSGSLRRLDAD